MTASRVDQVLRPDRPAAAPGRVRTRAVVVVALAATATAAVITLLSSMSAGPQPLQFEVVDHDTGAIAYQRPVAQGETFRLTHTHSVTGRLVVETFSILDPDTIAIEELWFDAPGPNLPTGPEPLGDGETSFVEEDGTYRVRHGGHPIGTVPMRVGSETVDHVLGFDDGEHVRLLDIARAGANVELTVRPEERVDG